ncbi:peroxide stress protein YaaA [Thiolapillus sp.]|uniref:peroxide stress protein YaaA n=1 Tax=Thiolapillus sp. TaxID=2017437 RepID=UPI003AF91280
MIITLSPSKGQDFETPVKAAHITKPQMLDESLLLIEELRKFSPAQVRDLMAVSENIANLNVDRYKSFSTPFTEKNARPALFAFKGDVYRGIPVEEYTQDDLDFAQDHLRMLSGLYCCLRPLDLIQPYRLEMKTRLKNPRGENLYQFWGDRLTECLNAELKNHKEPTLINLASNEYFKAVKPRLLECRLLNIAFKEEKNGKARIIAVFAKRARGMMADYIIRNRLEASEAIKSFDREGYRYSEQDSDDKQWVFVRPQP